MEVGTLVLSYLENLTKMNADAFISRLYRRSLLWPCRCLASDLCCTAALFKVDEVSMRVHILPSTMKLSQICIDPDSCWQSRHKPAVKAWWLLENMGTARQLPMLYNLRSGLRKNAFRRGSGNIQTSWTQGRTLILSCLDRGSRQTTIHRDTILTTPIKKGKKTWKLIRSHLQEKLKAKHTLWICRIWNAVNEQLWLNWRSSTTSHEILEYIRHKNNHKNTSQTDETDWRLLMLC